MYFTTLPASARLLRETAIAKARVSCPPAQKSEFVWQGVYSTVSLLGSAPLIDHIAHVMHLLGFPCENIAVVSIAWSQLDDCLD